MMHIKKVPVMKSAEKCLKLFMECQKLSIKMLVQPEEILFAYFLTSNTEDSIMHFKSTEYSHIVSVSAEMDA